MKQSAPNSKGFAHIATIGTTPPSGMTDIVDVLAEDIRSLQPAHLTIIATADSRENALRLIRGAGVDRRHSQIVEIPSAQSIDEAYRATGAILQDLELRGFPAERIQVHYTAGTKVMASGVVLAAVSHGCHSMRYLYSHGKGRASEPVVTSPRSVRSDRELQLARAMMRELRFRSAEHILEEIDPPLLSPAGQTDLQNLRVLSPAYAAWDNFRIREFLQLYQGLKGGAESAGDFRVPKAALEGLRRIARVDQTDGSYPVELVLDLYNNALRRLAERRSDDALIRLYRAAELFAQRILMVKYRIRTDDVDIRKVPPRNRVYFEAIRRLDDTKIKLGLRKAFELLAHLNDPVGHYFLEDERLQSVLEARRHLVLAHGTKPSPVQVALDMIEELEGVFVLEIPNFTKLADALQFPWIQNQQLLARLRESPRKGSSVSSPPEGPRPRRARRTKS